MHKVRGYFGWLLTTVFITYLLVVAAVGALAGT
jgi:hypothetical protein